MNYKCPLCRSSVRVLTGPAGTFWVPGGQAGWGGEPPTTTEPPDIQGNQDSNQTIAEWKTGKVGGAWAAMDVYHITS